ncbi:HD domain-containing protein [Paenibacillus mesophilus]|uniref:HD domain-containing protein n=1 Tax=Paenibacillus mesophilus TaxID=2582849 RepID=UPI00110E0289|nr:HD domain-containing protein [Paenibacillus mesophilus]TMV49025.1 HD domain-containing protein [Paenibacillus mesophilus]
MVQAQQIFVDDSVWEPLYQLRISAEPFERELFQSSPLRRLKHLHHFGAGALISPITHSRYEHTVGVWALTKHFYPDWRELHAAAIVHDIGHLPFSHSVEKTLGKNHHLLTEEAIASAPVSEILEKHQFTPSRIIDLLNQNTPLSGKTDGISIDHFDSFIRDTYGAGMHLVPPSRLVDKIKFNNHVIETDEETAMQLLHAVVTDNQIFLHPHFLAADEILAKAILLYREENRGILHSIDRLTDYQLLSLLEGSGSEAVRRHIDVLVKQPHRIIIRNNGEHGTYRAEVRKVYNKQPYVRGVPVSKVMPEAQLKLQELESLCRTYHFDMI